MTKKLYEQNIKQLLDTIDVNFKAKAILPSLILIYSCIDIMAWLNRDKTHTDNVRSDFKSWVGNYLLRDSGLNYDANDLYAARCSILHSYTPESKLSRQGEAKMIFYSWGVADGKQLQKYIDKSSLRDKAIVLHIDTLISALNIAVQHYNKALSKNYSLCKLVYKRSNKFFQNVPKEILDETSNTESA